VSQIVQHDFGSGSPVGHYCANSLGAPFKVYLVNGVKTESHPVTGKSMTIITDLPGLIAAVVRARVLHQRKLSGADLKYLRSALCLKSMVLAKAIDLTPEYYSRCENNQKIMSTTTEKHYRVYAYLSSLLKDRNLQSAVRAQKEKDLSPDKAKKALAAFQKLFFEMKICPVFDIDEELAFVFSRKECTNETPCGDDDAEWKPELEDIAA
jgi:hypothetical protein